ncbi:MAG: 2-keto-4-pentenoate hydratase [Burkholderiales bacterium]
MPPEQSYALARALHETRVREGWRPIGRKIGFTNRSIWPRYGVYEPIWGTVYDRTLIEAMDNRASVALEGLCQPRIEPEICFKLRAAPRSASSNELLAAIEWVAHSVEIVQCDQPGWKTSLEHSISFNGLHGRLIVGSRVPIDRLPDLEARLPRMEMTLRKDDAIVDHGLGEIVLGSPLAALGYLVRLLSTQPNAPPLAAGEIVSTGTLTDAHPVAPREAWSTEIEGLPLSGMRLTFT